MFLVIKDKAIKIDEILMFEVHYSPVYKEISERARVSTNEVKEDGVSFHLNCGTTFVIKDTTFDEVQFAIKKVIQ